MARALCSGGVRLCASLLFAAILIFHNCVSAADLSIYSDSLASGWADWSWGSSRNLAATSPVKSGTSSVAVTISAAWGALYLHSDAGVDLSGYDRIRFWIHGGGPGGQQLKVVANGTGSSGVVTAGANSWTQVEVMFSTLGSPARLNDLYWIDATGTTKPTFYLDDITLVASTTPPPPPPPPEAGPILTITADSGLHPISPDIYGMNFADEALAAELSLPVRRRGGNSTSRYNWQNDTYNTGSDWYFENIPENNPNPGILPDGSAADRFVEQDRRTGTKSLLTIPMIGWIAKERKSAHPYDCGFKVSRYGAQDSVDPWDSDCGNGLHNGGNLTGNSPSDTSLAETTDFVTGWITHLTGRYGGAAGGGVAYYNLDNEPMLWNSTHRDVHPLPVTYDEIRDRTYQYAPAVKAADPAAQTLGPVLWGWCAYFYSASDGCGIGADYRAHNNMPFVPWYLQQMHAYQQQHGVRILDYLDLHYYPQASGVSLSSAGSTSTQALRLRSTRSLWDPAYTDESWIGTPVRLIPRMREWVTANYPATKLAITEYNWGGLESINGALAQADVLGIFGREGVDLATLWGPPAANEPGAAAFRIFRNYDGEGHRFGETGVSASSSNQDTLSVYASLRTSDAALTVVIINKSDTVLTSSVNLAGFIPQSSAAVYRYSGAHLSAIVRDVDQPVTSSGFSASFPANSITLLVILPERMPLSVSVNGNGSGTVTSFPVGISCQAGSMTGCSSDFVTGNLVTLLATASTGSVFSGWGGVCGGTGECSMTMDGIRSASATFSSAPYVRIASTSYLSLQDAYDAAENGDTIRLMSGELSGSLLANRPVPVVIRGGFNAAYENQSLLTTVRGGIQLRQGSIVVDRVTLRSTE